LAEVSILRAALGYLALGWSVIPLRARDKRPVVSWQAYQQRPPAAGEVREWFRRWPTAGVAIVTGEVSGLVVADVDPSHGGEGSLEAMTEAHGPLPRTPEVITGGGGRHLYFAHPRGVVPNQVGLAPGLDLRGDGGYVVAPPSLHPSGGRYRWAPGRSPRRLRLADVPSWLLSPGEARRRGHSQAYWRELVCHGVAEGERNNTLASLAGHLFWRGVDPDVVAELLLCWNRVRCRPPLSDDEVARTVDSIWRTHERGQREGR